MINKVCHFEIGVRDQKRAADFYTQLFDWKLESKAEPGAPPMAMLRTGDDVGGHLNTLGHEPHNYTIFYIMVEDVAAAVAKAQSLGGKKIVGPVPLPNNTEFAWISDPEGNTIGLYAEKKR
jgi:predicted enzyme related to lactoylglutathione lyase